MAIKKKNAGKSKTTTKAKAKVAPRAAKAAPKATLARTTVPLKAVDRPRTKSDIFTALADATGMTRKDVGSVFAALGECIGLDVGKKGPGVFTVPGLMKVTRVNKPATKARKGINPFTGEETTFKAKLARNVVKVRPLKGLKEMV
ncbi:MAG: HU family DNA-binding protein [Proteobacteria bacterium]|nr:HU family DNA-binding protein [Pseudomonadota bacterium]